LKRQQFLFTVSFIFFLTILTACQKPEAIDVKMPNIIGMSLDNAQNILNETSTEFKINLKDLKSDRSILWSSNWKVVSQSPSPCLNIKSDESIDLGLMKNDETASTEFYKDCLIENKNGVNELPDTTTSSVVATADLALVQLATKLGVKYKPEISDSSCGKFAFLVQQNGSYNFYRWREASWEEEVVAVGSQFGPTMKSVQTIDVTGDGRKDFMVRLPSWDFLKKPLPMSGAVFASIDCKWQWLTFRTSTKQDWYQIDNLEWDQDKSLLYGGDEITDMDSPSYTGERITKLRFFKFNMISQDFKLTTGVPSAPPTTGITPKAIVVSSIALSEATFMCGTKLTDIIEQYGISDLSPKNIAKVWFQNSDYLMVNMQTPEEISRPIMAACEAAATSRIDQVEDIVISSCNWSASVLADAYGVSSKSKKAIARVIAQDFQEWLRPLVIPLCTQYIK